MKNKIIVKKNVSSRTYNFLKENSRSYIIDEQFHSQYLLEDLVSDLWFVILNAKNDREIYEFAKRLDVEEELDDFLKELENSNLITYTNTENQKTETEESENTELTHNNDEYDLFEDEKANWLVKNNLLGNLALTLSTKCNLNCRHCFNDKTHPEIEMTFQQAKDVIDQAYKLGITKVGISGGECTCCKDFLKIAKYVREKHLSLNILTNGQILNDNPSLLQEIINLYPNKVKISVYSMNPQIHDYITKKQGSLEKTLNVIKKLREKNIIVVVNFLQLEINKNCYKNVHDFAISVGANPEFSAAFINNKNNNNSNLRISPECLKKIYIDKNNPASLFANPPKETKEINKQRTICRAGEIIVCVNAKLKVTPCDDFDYNLGNLKETTLEKIWNEKLPIFRRNYTIENLKECYKDEYCKYCRYCSVRVIHDNEFMKKAPITCEQAKCYYEAVKEYEKMKKETVVKSCDEK